jgi:uncharacterized membrane protein
MIRFLLKNVLMGILSIPFWIVGILIFTVMGIIHFVPWWVKRKFKKNKLL